MAEQDGLQVQPVEPVQRRDCTIAVLVKAMQAKPSRAGRVVEVHHRVPGAEDATVLEDDREVAGRVPRCLHHPWPAGKVEGPILRQHRDLPDRAIAGSTGERAVQQVGDHARPPGLLPETGRRVRRVFPARDVSIVRAHVDRRATGRPNELSHAGVIGVVVGDEHCLDRPDLQSELVEERLQPGGVARIARVDEDRVAVLDDKEEAGPLGSGVEDPVGDLAECLPSDAVILSGRERR